MHRVILYTKDDCTLCKGVKATLEELRYEFDFLLEEVDITSDRDLYGRYRDIIPVVTVELEGATNRPPTTLTSRITEDDLRQVLAPCIRRRRGWWNIGPLKNLFRL